MAKRLRYALELFIDCFPPAVREQVYPRVEAVQDILGTANDSHQTVVLLDELLNVVRLTQPALSGIYSAAASKGCGPITSNANVSSGTHSPIGGGNGRHCGQRR